MSEDKSSYRQIMKATSIFGGVQVFNIIIQLIRSKIIAVLLGPMGMGIMGLLQTTLSLITSSTNFGLGISAVRDIAEANNIESKHKIAETVSVFRKLVWLTGLLGMVVTIVLSPLLSKMTFGNYDYTLGFVALAVSLLFNQLASAQTVLLQGLRKINWLAKANMYAAAIGLLISLPLYYFFRINGIIPSIILVAIVLFIVQYWFTHKIKIQAFALTFKEALYKGRGMLKLGFMLSLTGIISSAASYIIRIFISNKGSIEDVGLYNAGFAIIGTYVGLIFTAMGTDYYPRLSTVAHNNTESRKVINQQAEIALLILAPIIMIFLVFINWMIIILYSKKFIPVNDMILYAALGMFFKATSWAISFIFLAKGTSKLYFWNELLANIYILGLNILGYYYFGLIGLGISFLIAYILYLIQVYIIAKIKYDFFLSSGFVKLFIIQLLLAVTCLVCMKLTSSPYNYMLGSIIILISVVHAFVELDKRLELKKIFYSFKNRNR